MGAHELVKGLEVWTLQTLVNASILVGMFATGLAMAQAYTASLRSKLSLRVSIEVWDLLVVVVTDLLLVVVVLVGFLVLNPDIMADIKIALPFIPAGTALFASALVLRLFHGGHDTSNRYFKISLILMMTAVVIQITGFSFIMEAPSSDYLAAHPSAFWSFVKTHLRSNANPHGLELAQATFYVMFPVMLAIFSWGAVQALRQISRLRMKP